MAKVCDMCEEADPVWNCPTCDSSKCDDCDRMFHKPAKRSGHHRTPLKPVNTNENATPRVEVEQSVGATKEGLPNEQPSTGAPKVTQPIDLSFIKKDMKIGVSTPTGPTPMVTGYTYGNNMHSFPSLSSHPMFPGTEPSAFKHPHFQQPGAPTGTSNAFRYSNPNIGTTNAAVSGDTASPALDSSGMNSKASNADLQTVSSPRHQQAIMPHHAFPYWTTPQSTVPGMSHMNSFVSMNGPLNTMSGSHPRFPAPNVVQTGQPYPMNPFAPLPPYHMTNQFRPGDVRGASNPISGGPFAPPYGLGYHPINMHPSFDPRLCSPVDTTYPTVSTEEQPEGLKEEIKSDVNLEVTPLNTDGNVVSESSESEENPKFCVKCGKGLMEDFNFCAKCGHPVLRIKKSERNFEKHPIEEVTKLGEAVANLNLVIGCETNKLKAEEGADRFYTPIPSPVEEAIPATNSEGNTSECFGFDEKIEILEDFQPSNAAKTEAIAPLPKQYTEDLPLNATETEATAPLPVQYSDDDDMVIDGLSTFTFIKSKLLDGQDLNDLELLLSSDKYSYSDNNEEDTSKVIDEELEAINDVFGPLLSEDLGSHDVMKFASEIERRNAFEAAAFDSIKSSTLLVNWRKYLLECFLGNEFDADFFHDAMSQCQGDVRKTAIELLIGCVDNYNRHHIWNTDENENALGATNGNDGFDSLNTKTMTDVLLEESVSSFYSLPFSQRNYHAKQICARKLMAEKGLTYARAQLMVAMMMPGNDIKYISAFLAAKNLTDRNVIVPRGYKDYFKECVTCCEKVAQDFIIKFPKCAPDCSVCVGCVRKHFNAQVFESGKRVQNILCPGCDEKILGDESNAMVQEQLRSFLSAELFTMFEAKALENCLESDTNFRWCPHDGCSSGVFWENNNVLRMQCENGHLTCFKCGRKWKDQHQNVTCEEFSQWELENDPAYQNRKLDGFLRAMDAMICPECNYRYELVRGGCLHFTCSRCNSEFCGFCYARYSHGDCRRFARCAGLGFHAHCPRLEPSFVIETRGWFLTWSCDRCNEFLEFPFILLK